MGNVFSRECMAPRIPILANDIEPGTPSSSESITLELEQHEREIKELKLRVEDQASQILQHHDILTALDPALAEWDAAIACLHPRFDYLEGTITNFHERIKAIGHTHNSQHQEASSHAADKLRIESSTIALRVLTPPLTACIPSEHEGAFNIDRAGGTAPGYLARQEMTVDDLIQAIIERFEKAQQPDIEQWTRLMTAYKSMADGMTVVTPHKRTHAEFTDSTHESQLASPCRRLSKQSEHNVSLLNDDDDEHNFDHDHDIVAPIPPVIDLSMIDDVSSNSLDEFPPPKRYRPLQHPNDKVTRPQAAKPAQCTLRPDFILVESSDAGSPVMRSNQEDIRHSNRVRRPNLRAMQIYVQDAPTLTPFEVQEMIVPTSFS